MTRLLSTICFTLAAYCARRAMYWAWHARVSEFIGRDDWARKERARERFWDRRMKRLLVWGGIREGVLRD